MDHDFGKGSKFYLRIKTTVKIDEEVLINRMNPENNEKQIHLPSSVEFNSEHSLLVENIHTLERENSLIRKK